MMIMLARCKLCRGMAEIRRSHLLPSAIYRLMRDDDGPLTHPISIAQGVAQTTSRELRAPLLCGACEQLFHRCGEEWVLRRIYRGDEGFELHDVVTASPVHQSSTLGSAYEGKRNPAVDVEKLAYFALSVFWRFDVWDGKYCSNNPVELGSKYSEVFRQYLLAERGVFPRDICLIVALARPASAKLAAYMPVGGRAQKDVRLHVYDFLVPGIRFHLSVGAALDSTTRSLCIGNSSEGLIFLVDDVYADSIANMARVASSARRVGALSKSRS
jgi:hypothetical protein